MAAACATTSTSYCSMMLPSTLSDHFVTPRLHNTHALQKRLLEVSKACSPSSPFNRRSSFCDETQARHGFNRIRSKNNLIHTKVTGNINHKTKKTQIQRSIRKTMPSQMQNSMTQMMSFLKSSENVKEKIRVELLDKGFPQFGEILTTLSTGSVFLSIPYLGGFDIEGPQSVLEAVSVLAAIIFIHECGHFFAAYFQNIHISKFSIGFGPTLFKLQGNKVEYSLRAIPLGGFVGFPDDDPESGFAADDPDLLKNRPILDRLLVTSAGVVANLIFAYFILFGQVLTQGLLQQEILPGVIVPDVISSSVAAKAGVHSGDVIVGVDGSILSTGETAVFDLVRSIKENPNRTLLFQVSRGQQPLEIKIVPDKSIDGTGKIGVQLAPNSRAVKVKAKDLKDAAMRAGKEFNRLFKTVTDGLKQVILNFSQTADKISGPVAIVAVGAEVARTDAAGLSQFAAIVNINLAVVNILPLPALDGGYILLIMLEALRGGKKLPNKVEQGIMSSGILLLIGVGTFLMVRDALNLGIELL